LAPENLAFGAGFLFKSAASGVEKILIPIKIMQLTRELKGTHSRMANVAEETRFELQRHRILRAAATCFNQKGFSGTSLKDVAKHLGLTDAALYYYVKSKEELVYQCYLRAAELGQRSDAARARGRAKRIRAGSPLHSIPR
jgi:hypothetical protein